MHPIHHTRVGCPLVLTQFKLFGGQPPSNQRNLALICTWGHGEGWTLNE